MKPGKGKRAGGAKDGTQGVGIYVYCIIRCPEVMKSFGKVGFGGEEVYTIEHKDFAPVVSNAIMKEYNVDEEDIEVHKAVVSEVMKEHTVLPVAYGMVFKNKKLLAVSMKAGNKAMKKAIKSVDNKVELGVKVVLPKDARDLDGKADQCKSDFVEALNCIAAETKPLKLFSDRLILNSSFLVDSGRVDDFSNAVGKLAEEYSVLKVQYSGPWPPYNFVDIQILGNKRGGFR